MKSNQYATGWNLSFEHWDSGDGTKLLAFKGGTGMDGLCEVSRHYRDETGFHRHSPAREYWVGSTGVCLVKAAPGDLITIRDRFTSSDGVRIHRLGGDGVFEEVGFRVRSEADIERIVGGRPSQFPMELGVCDNDLEFMFRRENPEWLRDVLDRQLEYWWRHDAWHYFHYCGRGLTQEQIFRGTKVAPERMLSRFAADLTPAQLDYCLRSVRCRAVFCAHPRRSSTFRKRIIRDFAVDILEFAVDLWSPLDLAGCAAVVPDFALQRRHYLSLKKQDAILAGATRGLTSSVAVSAGISPVLRRAIAESIGRDPRLWVEIYEHKWELIVNLVFGMEPVVAGADLLMTVVERLEGREKDELLFHLASAL